MTEKINKAVEYVKANGANDDVKNDAANIFADSYDEYLKIWNAIENM